MQGAGKSAATAPRAHPSGAPPLPRELQALPAVVLLATRLGRPPSDPQSCAPFPASDGVLCAGLPLAAPLAGTTILERASAPGALVGVVLAEHSGEGAASLAQALTRGLWSTPPGAAQDLPAPRQEHRAPPYALVLECWSCDSAKEPQSTPRMYLELRRE